MDIRSAASDAGKASGSCVQQCLKEVVCAQQKIEVQPLVGWCHGHRECPAGRITAPLPKRGSHFQGVWFNGPHIPRLLPSR